MKQFHFSDFSIKAWLIITGTLMAINIFFALTLMHMAPQAHVLAQLLTPNVMSFGQAIEATSFAAPVGDKKLIEEMLIRFYIENRLEFIPDIGEMAYRWGAGGPVRRLSSPAVYGQFIQSKGDYVTDSKNRTDTRSVHIRSVRRQNNIFTVDFDVYRQEGTAVQRPQSLRAVITIAESPAYRGFGRDFINPFGTVITKYDETKIIRNGGGVKKEN